MLPSFGRYVQIPFNCEYKIVVKKSEPVQFENILVLPAQEKLTDNQEEPHTFEFDKELYSKDELYPSDLVKISGPFEIDGYKALLIHVRPIQYNSAQKLLTGYGNISITINLKSKDNDSDISAEKEEPKRAKKSKEDIYPYIDPPLNREAYGNLFLNPRRRIEERVATYPSSVVLPFIPRGPEFLIIYDKTFQKAAEKLAKWKKMRGLRTQIVSIDSIGNTINKIKTFIRNKRKSLFSRLRYVMLFGDVDMIIPQTITGGPYGSNVTDYYYSTKTDPTGSTNYVLPWLSIGRIPVRTAEEGIATVDQIIAYERNPPCDSEYYRRMSFAAYFQDDPPQDGKANRSYMKTMEDIREHMLTLDFDVDRIYVSNNPNPQEYIDGTQIPNEVKNSIIDGDTATDILISSTAEGQLITGHRNHGGPDGWSHPSFKKNHLESITSKYPTMFYSINCLTGKFDLTAPTESFAEKILRMEGGAPSLVAATRSSNTWLNNDLMKALFDAMWAGVLPTFPDTTASYSVRHNRLGDILNYGKSYLPIKLSGSDDIIKDHFEIYHVIGDPTLELWKSLPITIRLKVKVTWQHLYISISSCPKHSVITIWYKGKLIKRIEPSSTHIKIPIRTITFPIPLPRKRIISICFWAPGHRFHKTNIKI